MQINYQPLPIYFARFRKRRRHLHFPARVKAPTPMTIFTARRILINYFQQRQAHNAFFFSQTLIADSYILFVVSVLSGQRSRGALGVTLGGQLRGAKKVFILPPARCQFYSRLAVNLTFLLQSLLINCFFAQRFELNSARPITCSLKLLIFLKHV
jgi:hypothetical protein